MLGIGKLRPPSNVALAGAVAPALLPGEQVLWCGRPVRLLVPWQAHLCVLSCAMLPAVIVLIQVLDYLCQVDLEPAWWALAAAAASFSAVMVTLYGSFLGLQWLRQGHTVYALTARAAIIKHGVLFPRTLVLDLPALQHLELTLGRQDLGTVTFGRASGVQRPEIPAFRHVRHARHVFELASRGRRRADSSEVVQLPEQDA